MGLGRRRQLLITAGALLAVPLVSVAQQPSARVFRVAYIATRSPAAEIADPVYPPRRGLIDALKQKGYSEGRNLVLDFRTAEGVIERIPDIAAEVVRLKPDVIVVPHTEVARIVAKSTTSIPIFSIAGDPVAARLAESYRRVGGNVTGIQAAGDLGVERKRLELLRLLAPKARRIALVASKDWWDGPYGQTMREAAAVLNLQPVHVQSTRAEFGSAFSEVSRKRADAVFFEASPAAFALRNEIGKFAVESRIPSACGHLEVVEAGCLMTYNFTISEAWQVFADAFDRVVKGTPMSELPVYHYNRYEFAVNVKTAKTIGLVIPPAVLARADRVIE